LLSVENQEAARRMIKDLNNLMESGGFKLAKWASNDSFKRYRSRQTSDNRQQGDTANAWFALESRRRRIHLCGVDY
ncbi:hypothetical protein T4D_6016, partial [Trichinella pseudospiralis]